MSFAVWGCGVDLWLHPPSDAVRVRVPGLGVGPLPASIRPCLVVRVAGEEKAEREKARETWRAKERVREQERD